MTYRSPRRSGPFTGLLAARLEPSSLLSHASNKTSRPGASVHRWRLVSVNPFTPFELSHREELSANHSALPTPPSALSIWPNRRRIVHQEVPRTTQRVIRI